MARRKKHNGSLGPCWFTAGDGGEACARALLMRMAAIGCGSMSQPLWPSDAAAGGSL